jgi:hypothetical protein
MVKFVMSLAVAGLAGLNQLSVYVVDFLVQAAD